MDLISRELVTLARRLGLSRSEEKVLEYFAKNVSVGVIRARKELEAMGIGDPERVIRSLISKGLIEDKGGCYNLSRELRSRLGV